MATMGFQVGALSFDKTITTGDLDRLEAAARSRFGMPNATDSEVASALAAWIYGQIVGMVKEEEDKAAVEAAADGVEEITLS